MSKSSRSFPPTCMWKRNFFRPNWGEPQASPTVTCWLGFLSRYIYIYIDRPTSVFDPAPGVKVGCCGQNLRVVTLCENDLLYWYMLRILHIRLRIRHWSNLSEFSFCVRLSALNHSAKKILGLRNWMPSSQRGRDFLLPQGQPATNHVLLFLIYLPNERAYPTKQRYYFNSLSCNLLSQLIDNSATKVRFFFFFLQTENWVTLLFHAVARC